MKRRQFLTKTAMLGGALALAPLIGACAQPGELTPELAPTVSPTEVPVSTAPPPPKPTLVAVAPDPTMIPTPSPTRGSMLGLVALVKTTDRAAGVRRAIELLGINPVRGRQVLLKPNFNSADPTPGSTHEEVLRTLLASLSDMGASGLTIADRSGMGDTGKVMGQKGVFDLAKSFNATTTVFEDLPDDDWQILEGDGFHWSRGFPVPKLLLDAEAVVQTCNLKTHSFGGHFTLSLKNSVGLVAKHHAAYNYMSELHNSQHQRRMIAEINTAYAPALIVLDGVEAFTKGGPATGTKAATEVILVGTDRIAMDAVGVAILRLFGTTPDVSRGRVFEQEQIARAVELELGVDAPEKITFATGDVASEDYAAQIREMLLA